jgi:P pilus assembly chaperone PapD
MRRLLFLVLILGFGTNIHYAQVTISPTSIFFENNFASFIVINNSAISQDILVDFAFGFPMADEFGSPSTRYGHEYGFADRDITPHVRAFPRAMTLAPGQRQTVRINLRPPRDLHDAVYWTRLKVVSTPEVAEVTAVEENVSAQFTFVFEQLLPVYFRNGNVSLSMNVNDVHILEAEENRRLLVDFTLEGNAPFLGTIDLSLSDRSDNTVHSDRTVTSIFHSEKRAFTIPSDLPAGTYTVSVNFTASRPDVPAAQMFPMNPVRYTQTIQIP